jgi:glycine/D-amino acid oxidase-like deaminating enzyme
MNFRASSRILAEDDLLAKSDVAVVGGGVIGCAVAYYLSKQGARVTVIERSSVGGGASAANSGSIALATKKAGFALELAIASQRLYPGLSRELGMDIEYVVEGNLIVAETENEAGYLEDLAKAQQAAGVPVLIVSAARCQELNPLIEGRVLSGLYCPTDAQANPFKVTQAFACAAQNHGAQIFAGAQVNAIETEGNRVSRVVTSCGDIHVGWVVNAAGAYASDIGKMVGTPHEVLPRRGQIVVLEATADLPAIRVSGAGQLLAKHGGASPGNSREATNVALSYTSKPLSGTVLLGSTNEFVGYDTSTTLQAVAGICRCASRLMPQLGRLNALRSWAGLRPYSAKGPIMGRAGGPDGYVAAIGHGGDGVALSPITGLYLAEFIALEGKGCDLPAFLGDLKSSPAPAPA